MYAVGDAYRLHTKCIQNAYKHIRRGKERNSSLLLLIPPVFLSLLPVFTGNQNFLFASSDMYGYHRAIRITHQPSLPVPLGRGRPQFTTNHLARELYALYASKNRLCTLCEDTTPELTAYNAYKSANRRVRRAEGTKMYALKDAYKVHTSEYEHIKSKKRENSSSASSLYCLFFYLLLPASSGNPRQTVNDFYCLFSQTTGFSGFHRPSDGLSATIPTHS